MIRLLDFWPSKIRFFFGAKTREDLHQKNTIYTSEKKAKNSKIYVNWFRHAHEKGTNYFSEPKQRQTGEKGHELFFEAEIPRDTIIRHDTIIPLLLVSLRKLVVYSASASAGKYMYARARSQLGCRVMAYQIYFATPSVGVAAWLNSEERIFALS